MSKVEIYTTPTCPYCHAAKALLEGRGISYTEIDVLDPELRDAMTRRANGRRTVPQVFVGQTHVGGFDDLSALDRKGDLEPLVSGAQ